MNIIALSPTLSIIFVMSIICWVIVRGVSKIRERNQDSSSREILRAEAFMAQERAYAARP